MLNVSCPRFFAGFKAKVKQRRRTRGKIIQLKQTHYEPKPDGCEPLPVSILGTGIVRRLITSPKNDCKELLEKIDWQKYKTGQRGVRWHPVGAFRVQFKRHKPEWNFHVKVNAYFRVGLYGFEEAKARAIAYRKRLEQEWIEQERIWKVLEMKQEIRKWEKKKLKQQMLTGNAGTSHQQGGGILPIDGAASFV